MDDSRVFESVIGFGTISELTAIEDKAAGLNRIMEHYSGREWTIEPAAVATTRVWRIAVDSVTGKCSEEKPTVETEEVR